MTSRIVRGNRTKIFLCVSGILAIVGLLICYDNILSELAEVKNANKMCHQQQENLSTQLQVISDYKQKLEKSLKSAKAEHQQNKADMEIKMNEEKNKNEKLSNDALLKYNSLQQHYSLLQTENEDVKEECKNTQKRHLEENNSLQSKLKELKEELKKVEASREQLKTRFIEIKLENTKLKLLNNKKSSDNEANNYARYFADKYHDAYEQLNYLKQKCHDEPSAKDNAEKRNPSDKSGIYLPIFKGVEQPSSSTKSGSKPSSSPQSKLNGVHPLVLPSITPETLKKDVFPIPPQAVPAMSKNQENQNEQPDTKKNEDNNQKDDAEKDNGAHEVFDSFPNNNNINNNNNNGDFDGLAIADDLLKQDQKGDENTREKKKKLQDGDYKDLPHEEDADDDDPYVDNAPRQADPVIRN